MWLAAFVLILAGISFALALKQQREDKAVLRHTIRVNLAILQAELTELNGLALEQADTSDGRQAQALLVLSSALADEAAQELNTASEKMLGRKLSIAFSAMDLSMRARYLLKAVRSPALDE
jgi:hypothetical protein